MHLRIEALGVERQGNRNWNNTWMRGDHGLGREVEFVTGAHSGRKPFRAVVFKL